MSLILPTLSKNTDVPFHTDASYRYFPQVLAIMMALALLSLMAFLTTRHVVSYWQSAMVGEIVVQINPAAADARSTIDQRVQDVAQILKNYVGVEHVDVVSETRSQTLLEPWLGEGLELLDWPLPRLVSVRISDPDVFDLERLQQQLSERIPGVQIDQHNAWLQGILGFVSTVQWVAMTVTALVLLAAILMVIFVTQASLMIHVQTIEILHLIGARDDYIAWQFQVQAFLLTAKAGLWSLLMAALLVVMLHWAASGTALLPATASLTTADYVMALALPFVMALVAALTARLTVLRTLRMVI